MASPFANIERVTAQVVDRVMAEEVLFQPRREGKYSAGGIDPDRPEKSLMAVVTKDGGLQRTDGASLGQDFGFKMVAGEYRISVDLSLFASVSERPRKGDYFQLVDRPLKPFVEVVHPDPDNIDHILLHCTKVASP